MDTETMEQTALEKLAGDFGGTLLEDGDAGYDEARSVFNAMIDRRPALIARCSGPTDVVAAIRYAREHDLPVAVRAGGHSAAGHGTCDDGVLVDLTPMTGVRVDPVRKVARANGGALWGEFDRETQAFGLATPGGRITTTGIGGFTLGGGYGWLSPKYGLTCDNLISADVVTADGRFLVASEQENEDLFWALCGGGGNFGVVTSFEFRLHEVGPMIYGGLLLYPSDRARDALGKYLEVAGDAPDELATGTALLTAPPMPFIPEPHHGQQVLGIIVAHCGDPTDGERLAAPLRDVEPITDLVGPIPYRGLQALMEDFGPFGFRSYWRGEHLTDLTEDVIDTYLQHPPEGLYPLSSLIIFQHGGAVSRVDDHATAFSHRGAAFMVHPIGCWEDESDDERHIAWVKGASEAMKPFKTGGIYLNFMSDDEADRVRTGYGDAKYERLATLKAKYDPDNVFRFNQNIIPAAPAGV